MEAQKIVLVTGSNKGIGFGIIQGLLKQKSKLKLILTSRNTDLGKQALEKLKKAYPDDMDHVLYHQLDIENEKSINESFKWIKENFGKIDYLVNNAGVLSKKDDCNLDVFDYTFKVNVFGTLSFTESVLKNEIINKNGKIIIVGSDWGSLHYLSSKDLINEFRKAQTTEDLLNLANKYKTSIASNTVTKDGWCMNTYKVSKMIANTYAKVLSYRKEIINNNISVYACSPGWVNTDMGGHGAPLSIEKGAKTEIFLLNLSDGIDAKYQGKYFDCCKVSDFYMEKSLI